MGAGIPDQTGITPLWDNELSGKIPAELSWLANLQSLILSVNQLSGEIPPELHALARLESLSLESNQLTGRIPPGIRRPQQPSLADPLRQPVERHNTARTKPVSPAQSAFPFRQPIQRGNTPGIE